MDNRSLSQPHPKQETQTSPVEPKNTWVYIWKTAKGNIGHASMQVGGNEPKLSDEANGQYMSLWPGKIPAIGLTAALPLHAGLANHLMEDRISEDHQKRTTFFNDPERNPLGTENLVNPEGIPPDYIYKFTNLDTDAIENRMTKVREEVKTGRLRYQLLPNINLFRFFSEAAAHLSYDPVDITQVRQANAFRELPYQAHNCSSLVADILTEGGLPIKESNMPMKVSPNYLAKQLEQLEQLEQLDAMTENTLRLNK